jgi:hypothetical protein
MFAAIRLVGFHPPHIFCSISTFSIRTLWRNATTIISPSVPLLISCMNLQYNFSTVLLLSSFITYCVRDVQLVIIRNVFGTCADKMNADRGIDIINLMLKSH